MKTPLVLMLRSLLSLLDGDDGHGLSLIAKVNKNSEEEAQEIAALG